MLADQTDANPVGDTLDASSIGTTSATISASRGHSDPSDSPPSLQLLKYNFNHRRRGRAIIINNRDFNKLLTGQSNRDGTDVDASALESTFVGLGLDVIRYDNLTTLDMSMNLREAASEDHSDADCFVCAILSHGEEGVVYGTNGTIKLEKIFSFFKGDVCRSLRGKPKIFFVQACRGRKYDWGAVMIADPDEVDSGGPGQKIPVEADFLMAYSVSPGYFSWRNNVDGSWFIQALVKVLQAHSDRLDLMSMMTIVNQYVAYDFESCTDDDFTSDMKQMPSIVSTLTRQIFFPPRS